MLTARTLHGKVWITQLGQHQRRLAIKLGLIQTLLRLFGGGAHNNRKTGRIKANYIAFVVFAQPFDGLVQVLVVEQQQIRICAEYGQPWWTFSVPEFRKTGKNDKKFLTLAQRNRVRFD